MSSANENNWWEDFFDETYAEIGFVPRSDRAQTSLAADVDRLIDLLRVHPGDLIFDQCCGVGRLSIPLAARGFSVIGVDLSPRYVERARAEADRQSLPCEFYADDAFAFRAPRPCDAAFNWFTSFGYHSDDRVNRQMLGRVAESLRPGGRFALDMVSTPRVLKDYHPAMVSRHQGSAGDVLLIQEPRIDFRAGMVRAEWTFLLADGSRQVRRTAVRAYMPSELVALFEAAGFVDIELLGADSKPFDRASLRTVVVGTKPRSS